MVSLFSIIVFLIVLFIVASIWWYLTIPPNLPAGPVGLPFLGSSFETWDALTLHTKLHKRTKIYGSLYKFYVAEKLVLVLGDWNMIQEALVKQGDAFAGRPQIHTGALKSKAPRMGLIHSEGEFWKTQRRFAMSTLRDFGVGKSILESKIKDKAEVLIKAMAAENNQAFDLVILLTNAISNVICALVFGHCFEYEDQNFKALLRTVSSRADINISFLSPFVLSPRLATILSKLPQIKRLKNSATNVVGFLKEKADQVVNGWEHQNCYDRQDNGRV